MRANNLAICLVFKLSNNAQCLVKKILGQKKKKRRKRSQGYEVTNLRDSRPARI
jgi:hypothetical protein